MHRTSNRQSTLKLLSTIAIATAFTTAFTTACRSAKKDDTASADAGSSAASASSVAAAVAVAASDPAPPASAATPPDTEPDVPTDAGVDAGRKRRRLVDAGAGDTNTTTASATSPEEPSARPKTGRTAPVPMENDGVYGASAASGAAVLKKKPLPSDDPWGGKR